MKKLLWLSDSPTTATGYGIMSRNICSFLKKDYEVHFLAHNYFGHTAKQIILEDNTKIDFFLHGMGQKKYAMDKISPIIRKYDIDIFGGLLDTFMLEDAGFMNIDTSPAKTFFYFPSDGGGKLPSPDILKKVDMPIAMSKFGQAQALKVHKIKTEYIPHAFDDKIFYPLDDIKKEQARIRWGLTGKFVVGTVARNQNRKMLDRTVKAFALFCKDKPEAILLMGTDPNDLVQCFNLNGLIQRYGIQNRIIYTGSTFSNPFTYEQMNEVYNLMDIFFLTTSGEGFGVPTIEAQACGVPQIVTDYTTSAELIKENHPSGELVRLADEEGFTPWPHTDEILSGTLTGPFNVERALMSVYGAVDKLNLLYKNHSLRRMYKENSIKKAKDFTWQKIMPMWRKTLKCLE